MTTFFYYLILQKKLVDMKQLLQQYWLRGGGATNWFNYMHNGMCQNTFPKSKSKRSVIQIQNTWWENR